jgi:hypothetical protein
MYDALLVVAEGSGALLSVALVPLISQRRRLRLGELSAQDMGLPHPNSVTPMLGYLLCLAIGLLSGAGTATADDTPSPHDLATSIVEKYHLTTDSIADALTFWGTNQLSPDSEPPRLVRWVQDPLRFAVVLTSEDTKEAVAFARSMNTVARAIGRKTEYCSQRIEPSEGGGYAPTLDQQRCQSIPYDIVVLIDTSSMSPTQLFEDFATRAQTSTERQFWQARASAGPEAFSDTSCDEVFRIEPDKSAIVSGAIYLRVPDKTASDDPKLTQCLLGLPYLILGQRPIQVSDVQRVFALEMLELTYSPELRAGMTLREVIRALSK